MIINQKLADEYLKLAKSFAPNMKAPKIELWSYACKFAEIFNSGKVETLGFELFDLSEQKGVGLTKGSFSCTADVEDGRVNVNRASSLAEKQALYFRLFPLLRSLKQVQDENDQELTELVANIIDYVDADDNKTTVVPGGQLQDGGGAGESSSMGLSSKNAMLDTIEELRLVDKMDDETFCLLKDRVTVYLTEKINVNSADLYVLRSLLCENLSIPEEQLRCQMGMGLHPVDLALEWVEVCRRIKRSLFTPPFSTTRHFTTFFKRLPEPLNSEIPLNTAALQKHISTDAKIIRLKSVGTYGPITKHLEAVVDTSTGRYIYWREN